MRASKRDKWRPLMRVIMNLGSVETMRLKSEASTANVHVLTTRACNCQSALYEYV